MQVQLLELTIPLENNTRAEIRCWFENKLGYAADVEVNGHNGGHFSWPIKGRYNKLDEETFYTSMMAALPSVLAHLKCCCPEIFEGGGGEKDVPFT